jgi:hypothetical protein
MEYVILRASHPTYLNLQLPGEVAQLIEFDASEDRAGRTLARSVAFFARGTGVARVVSSARAGSQIPIETVRERLLATARLTDKLVFSLPEALSRHLGLHLQPREVGGPRMTDDGILWFLPAPEYYEFRAQERAGKSWTGIRGGGMARVYVAKSELPGYPELERLENRIEQEEWEAPPVAPSRPARLRPA